MSTVRDVIPFLNGRQPASEAEWRRERGVGELLIPIRPLSCSDSHCCSYDAFPARRLNGRSENEARNWICIFNFDRRAESSASST